MSLLNSFWHTTFEINPGRNNTMPTQNSLTDDESLKAYLMNSIRELKCHNPFMLIKMELAMQEAKYGVQDYNDFQYLSIIAEEFGEVSKAVCEQLQNNYTALAIRENLEIELVQVASVCIAWIECIRRRDNVVLPHINGDRI